MIVQFSINPMDSEHISEDMRRITDYLDEAGIEYKVGAIGTSVEGNWETVMPIIEECHRLTTLNHTRVLTTITIDDHKGQDHSLRGAVEASHREINDDDDDGGREYPM